MKQGKIKGRGDQHVSCLVWTVNSMDRLVLYSNHTVNRHDCSVKNIASLKNNTGLSRTPAFCGGRQ